MIPMRSRREPGQIWESRPFGRREYGQREGEVSLTNWGKGDKLTT